MQIMYQVRDNAAKIREEPLNCQLLLAKQTNFLSLVAPFKQIARSVAAFGKNLWRFILDRPRISEARRGLFRDLF